MSLLMICSHRPLSTVPNVTMHPTRTTVPTAILLLIYKRQLSQAITPISVIEMLKGKLYRVRLKTHDENCYFSETTL